MYVWTAADRIVFDPGDPDTKQSFTRAKLWWFDYYFDNAMKCHGEWIRYVCNIGVNDLPWVVASPHMFVNKIRLEAAPSAFSCLELWYRDRVSRQWRLMANGNDSFDVSLYASQPFVRNHVRVTFPVAYWWHNMHSRIYAAVRCPSVCLSQHALQRRE